MNRSITVLCLALAIAAGFLPEATGIAAQAKGPVAERLVIAPVADRDSALAELAAGSAQLFWDPFDAAALKSLPADTLAKLDAYGAATLSWSVLLNPYPNKPPFVVETKEKDAKEAKTRFNPFAIKEVRYALQWLVDRRALAAECFGGAPAFTPALPGQPGAVRYSLAAARLGISADGDEARALKAIDEAMTAASRLPANAGKLRRAVDWWTWNGVPVELDFLIRNDDSRLAAGRWLADKIEKAGFKVNRLEKDAAGCADLVKRADPSAFGWSLYTEAWRAGQASAWWDTQAAFLYAPQFGQLPGGGRKDQWQYASGPIDTLAEETMAGRYRDEAEYWTRNLALAEAGLKESVRIFLAAGSETLLAAKAAPKQRPAWGPGEGPGWYFLAGLGPAGGTARILAPVDGGRLFAAPWDPVGAAGFADRNSGLALRALCDPAFGLNPVGGQPFAAGVAWSDVQSDLAIDDKGAASGRIKVPTEALLWNAAERKWLPGLEYADAKGDGTGWAWIKKADQTAVSSAVFTFKGGRMHHGRETGLADYLYAFAAQSAGADPALAADIAMVKGWLPAADRKSVKIFWDGAFPPDKSVLAIRGAPVLDLQAERRGSVVAWEIQEALADLVRKPGKSGAAWGFAAVEGTREVDLLDADCVADIAVRLKEFEIARHVPASLTDWVKPADAVWGYQLAQAFIAKRGHAFISNGPFFLDAWNPAANTASLVAFRDPAYPWEKGWFAKTLAGQALRIDSVMAQPAERGKPLSVALRLSRIAYPEGSALPADKASVRLILPGTPDKEFPAVLSKTGEYLVTVPAEAWATLPAGRLAAQVEASGTGLAAVAVPVSLDLP
jgi:peptide/nickel transport system substrate-binding protein